jgi:hypothetical protein
MEGLGCFKGRQVATGIEGKVWPVSMEGRLHQEKNGRSGLFQRKAGCDRNGRNGLACFKGRQVATGIEGKVWPVSKEGRLQQE